MQKKLRYVRILCLALIDTFQNLQVSYGIQNWHPALVIMTLKYETKLF